MMEDISWFLTHNDYLSTLLIAPASIPSLRKNIFEYSRNSQIQAYILETGGLPEGLGHFRPRDNRLLST